MKNLKNKLKTTIVPSGLPEGNEMLQEKARKNKFVEQEKLIIIR